MRGLIIGRFQPLHNGHVAVIMEAAKVCDEIVIVIGSVQLKNKDNPLAAEERKEILESVLADRGIKNYHIVELEDIPKDEEWVDYVVENTPEFEVVFSGEGSDLDLWKNSGFELRSIGRVGRIHATDIRNKIRSGDDSWVEDVPEEVIKYLKITKM